MNDIQIKVLTDCQEHVPHLAKLWYEGISRHWIPDASVEIAMERLKKHLHHDLPMAFVAIQDAKPVGMVCLRITDGIQPDLTPWLGSLVVDPRLQRKKIGETLIDRVKEKAKALGYVNLYLLAFDPTIPDWYAKLGWRKMGVDYLFGHEVTVMSIGL